MQKERIEHFKRLLLDERRRQAIIAGLMDEDGLNVSLGESTSELSAYDNHPADIGTEVFERSKDFALREQAMITINAIEEALGKMEGGTYGVCGDCGREIYLKVLDEALREANKRDFKCVAVSAGFDSHSGDLASLGLTEESYYEIGRRIASLERPVFFVLEGGYSGKQVGRDIGSLLRGLNN